MSPESRRDVVELAEQLCTGILSDDDFARLNQLLRDDVDAQRAFLSVTTVHAGLQREFAGDPTWLKPTEPTEECKRSQGRSRWNRRRLAVAVGIAAAVLLAILFSPLSPPLLPIRSPEPIATVRQALNARWTAGSEPRGNSVVPGRMRLETGLVDITFFTGTVAILKGPVDVELLGVDRAFLHSGQMVVRVPHKDNDVRFQVDTVTSQVVDLGTEFGVEVEDDGSSVLQVYEGEVLASAKGTADWAEPRRVYKGEAVRVEAAVRETAFWPERFVRLLPGPHDPLGRRNFPYNKSRHDSIRIVRAKPGITIDGDLSDWDLTHQFRSECEPPYAENYYLEGAMMYDEKFLYIGAHVGDPHPMRNQYSPKEPFDKHGMGGGVALRLSTDRQVGWPLKAERARTRKGRTPSPADISDKLSFVVLWYNEPEQQACIHLRHGMDLHGRQVNPAGFQGAFRRDPNNRGYTLEYIIPWKALYAEEDPPRGGDLLAAMWLAHWSDAAGLNWRGQLIDVMKPEEPGWNFERAATWGKAIYLP